MKKATIRKDSFLDYSIQLEVPTGIWARGIGLMGRTEIKMDEGMLFMNCRSLTSWFMRFSLGVLWLTEDFSIVKKGTLDPWKIVKCSDAFHVLELNRDSPLLGLNKGDRLDIVFHHEVE